MQIERRFQPWTWRVRLRHLDGWRGLVASFLAGMLAVLALAPYHIWPVWIVSLAVLLWRLDGARRGPKPLRGGFVTGLVFGMGYFLAGTFWVGFAFINRGPEFAALVPIALPLFAAMLAVFWGIAGAIYARFAQNTEWRVLSFAAIFALTEWLRSHIFSGLPWNLPAYTWSAGGAVSQSASWLGVYGLSFLTLLMFAAPAMLATRGLGPRRLLPALSGFALLCVLFFAGGLRLLSTTVPDVQDVRLRIAHSNITQAEKWGDDGEHVARDRYMSLTRQPGLDEVTHVLWPEGALPIYMLEDGQTLSRLGAALNDGPALIAGINRRARAGEEVVYHNSLAAMRFQGGELSVDALYDKVLLVPFGETIPMASLISAIGFDEFARLQFTPGPRAIVAEIPGLPPMMPLICYEAIFPHFWQSTSERPEWFFNLSNDAWFGDTSGPRQHLVQSRYRSIEAGIPLIRSASRGFSGVVDPLGRMPVMIAPDQEGAFDVTLPRALAPTPYSLYGDLLFWLMVLGVFAGLAVQKLRFIKKQKISQP
ncbi:apolipoprotein N-acyltransferase [Maricaulis sp.]|uniref:apolipoprotein N-acyltransferase n=1 Tax=Maricaulis sp. TaxID=1486257 RepID=UPI001B299D21|nr:apolipoprotein N-acyltransferase [Maricaulis sp.]MBO6795689.1 apolipoprotein N-acyltransferase [Maricaulis sp.]